MSLAFEKVQGLGNDFVLLDARRTATLITPAAARRLCDRHFGIGADGVLTLLQARHPAAAARMHVYNADGSEAEMCGNGLRCVARVLFDERPGTALRVETGAGLRECRAAGPDVWVEVGGARVGEPEEIELPGERLRGTPVDLGNPHFVVFEPFEGGRDDARLRQLGSAIEHHPRFAPARTNVELCERTAEGLRVAVFERGSGLTLACGTGAAAAAAAAVRQGLAEAGRELAVDLPGGRLHAQVAADSTVALRGPAVRVYRGEIDLEAAAGDPSAARPWKT